MRLMKKLRNSTKLLRVIVPIVVLLSLVVASGAYKSDTASAATGASSTNPCVGSTKPASWKHIVVLMFENHTYNQVIGNSDAPYISNLASKCATNKNWSDANYRVDGTTKDGSYNSKPSYATLTSGVSPTVHGLKDDTYSTKSNVDNIYNQLRAKGISNKSYFSWSGTGCSAKGSGDYHDAIRYYNNIDSTYCNAHDVNVSTFMNDVNSGSLPAFSVVYPTNCENMHSCSSVSNVVKNGDDWAKAFLNPLLDSAQYKSGDTAVFFLWDEDTPIPNVLLAPSVTPGCTIPSSACDITPASNGNTHVSHFAALRTWSEMLGLPLIGDTNKAPSLLPTFNNGGGCGTSCTTDNPPTVNLTSPSNGATLDAGVINVTANASDDNAVTKVEFYVDGALKGTDTSSPYSYSWDASLVTGSHSITAKAYDGVNPAVTSSAVSVTIKDPNACTTPTVNSTASMSVSVPATSIYRLWVRVNAADANSNAFYVKVDGDCPVVMGDASSMPTGTWTWIDYKDGNTSSKITLGLDAGTHNVILMGKENGVKIDKVLLLASSCTPTSASASECIDTTAPTVNITAPTSGQEVSGNVNVTATASDSSGVAKVRYYVDSSTTPFAEDTSSPYSVTWNSKTVSDGTHTLRADAVDTVGNVSSKVSVSVTVNNADVTPPSVPANLKVTKNESAEVDLAWDASTDDRGVTGYNIYRNGNPAPFSTVTGTTFKDISVTPSTSYVYQVEAFDAAGNKSAKVSVNVTTPADVDTEAPTAPTNLTANNIVPSGSQTVGAVGLNWTKSTDNVGVTSYLVRRDGIVIASVTGTTYTDASVQPSTKYSYAVIARDAAGNSSPESNTATITTPNVTPPVDNPPTKPTGLTALAASSSQVNLSWNPSTDDIGVLGYKIYRNNSTTPIGTTTDTTFGDSTVAAGQTYTYQVAAFDKTQDGPKSDVVTVKIPPDSGNTDFKDDFSQGAGSWTTVKGIWQIGTDGNQGNVYTQSADNDAWATAGSSSWSDYSVEAKIKPTEFLDAGSNSTFASLYGRWQDQSHWYYVTLRNTGVIQLKRNDGNNYTVLDTKDVGIKAGQWYTVKLDMKGSSLKVYLNGQETLSATDSTFTSGKIGLGSYYAKAMYDDVRVTTSGEPQILEILPSDDAYVVKRYPNRNYGDNTSFLIDTSPQRDGLLKFTVSGINGRTVTSAYLRLYAVGNSDKGGDFDPAGNNWSEGTVTWNNAPAAESPFRIASLGSGSKNTFVVVDVRNFIHGDGTYTLRISSPSDDTMSYSTKEDVSKENTVAPRLVMTVEN